MWFAPEEVKECDTRVANLGLNIFLLFSFLFFLLLLLLLLMNDKEAHNFSHMTDHSRWCHRSGFKEETRRIRIRCMLKTYIPHGKYIMPSWLRHGY